MAGTGYHLVCFGSFNLLQSLLGTTGRQRMLIPAPSHKVRVANTGSYCFHVLYLGRNSYLSPIPLTPHCLGMVSFLSALSLVPGGPLISSWLLQLFQSRKPMLQSLPGEPSAPPLQCFMADHLVLFFHLVYFGLWVPAEQKCILWFLFHSWGGQAHRDVIQ